MGNSTRATVALGEEEGFNSSVPCPSRRLSTDELLFLVVCADSYDAPQPSEGLEWRGQLWVNMTDRSWISGNSRFLDVFPCRHFTRYWPHVSEVYRGELDHALRNPTLLIHIHK